MGLACRWPAPRPRRTSTIRFSSSLFERLFLAAFAVVARIGTVYADKAFDAEHHRDLCRWFSAEPAIHKRGRPRGSGLSKRRWPVESSLAWLLDNRRLALRYDRLGFIVQLLLQAVAYSWLRDASLGNSDNRLLVP